MDVATFPDDPAPRWHNPVLALGNFDGLHRGHMKIIDRVRQRAGERAGTPAAMTFDPHPPRVLRPDKAPALLMTPAQKVEALRRSGMQGLAVVRFTRELSTWDPEMFVRTVLVDWLHVAEVWVGANFLFGHERAGTFSVLRSLGARYGFRAENIGMRPTFGDVDSPVIETHVLDFDRDLYDGALRLSFVQRLRDERTFPDVDALRAQIDADTRSARRLFGRISL